MNLIFQSFAWIFNAKQWTSTPSNPSIAVRLAEHLYYGGVSLLVVVVIAVPIGLIIGHTGRGRAGAILASNVARGLPTLGLLAVLIPVMGIGLLPTVIVLVILGIPPLLAGVYAGIESVDREPIDAARAVGMTEWQILFTVEIPLSAALLIGGLRAATLQIIATVTVGAYFSLGGLGRYIVDGFASNDFPQMIGGSILVIVLALVIDGILAIVQRFAVPRGVSRGVTDRKRTTARGGSLPAVMVRTPIKEGS